MNILLKINYLQLTAKASFSFFKFNPRLKPGAINPHYSRASAINLLFNRTLLLKNYGNQMNKLFVDTNIVKKAGVPFPGLPPVYYNLKYQ
jgi:hypothetical protein